MLVSSGQVGLQWAHAPVSLEAFRTGRDACLERAAEELEQMASGALTE